jgi:nicotinate-nucleotide pyrophosphorylase (carboxylating)
MKKMDSDIKRIVELALKEDIGSGDITSKSIVSKSLTARAEIIVKQEGIIAGLFVAEYICKVFDRELKFKPKIKDGSRVTAGITVAEIYGSFRSLLTIERTLLNFLQRISGIATAASVYVAELEGLKTKILDTRKTAPGLRLLDKYAIKTGGGKNHRIGLYDMVLIKENHISAAGSIVRAVNLVRKHSPKVKIEVEVSNLESVSEALKSKADIIMLDNMDMSSMREAVALVNGRCKIEASGGITLANLREAAETGVDYISVGALTHSVKALDIAMYIERD